MLYRVEMLVSNKMQTIQQNVCVQQVSSLTQVERSPFHHDSLIRVRGMIIQELSCQPCKVTVNLGYQRGNMCHSEYLPVYLNDEAVYLDALGLIVEDPVLDKVDCNEIFTPIFETMAEQHASGLILIIWTLRIIQRLLAVVAVKKQGFDEPY